MLQIYIPKANGLKLLNVHSWSRSGLSPPRMPHSLKPSLPLFHSLRHFLSFDSFCSLSLSLFFTSLFLFYTFFFLPFCLSFSTPRLFSPTVFSPSFISSSVSSIVPIVLSLRIYWQTIFYRIILSSLLYISFPSFVSPIHLSAMWWRKITQETMSSCIGVLLWQFLQFSCYVILALSSTVFSSRIYSYSLYIYRWREIPGACTPLRHISAANNLHRKTKLSLTRDEFRAHSIRSTWLISPLIALTAQKKKEICDSTFLIEIKYTSYLVIIQYCFGIWFYCKKKVLK